jgi:peptide/nickel transport system ATP-binding protein
MSVNKKVLKVEDLRVYFHTKKGDSKAVDGNHFTMYENETLAIVGESGCGKSVTAMSILGLVAEPGEIMPGSKIVYTGNVERDEQGLNLAEATGDEIRNIRGNEISMIFQEPMSSLNPVITVGDQIMENILTHEEVSKEEAKQRAVELLAEVGISRPEKVVDNYPFQLSGGMCQRVMIAMALSCHPKLLIADEPTTALDVTIQAQILSLMNKLKKETGTSIMLITHDLGVVAQVADNVNVMYAGKVVETAPVEELFANPKHPYTVGLMSSMPSLAEEGKRLNTIEGSVPNPLYLPKGCYFADRCPHASERCKQGQPTDTKIKSRHHVWCFKVEEEMKQEG